MSKRLLIDMPDGSVWQIPFEFIAACKASALLTDEMVENIMKDESLTDTQKIQKLHADGQVLLKEVSVDENALLDWAREKLDWKDVVQYASIFSSPDTSDLYTAGWKSGEMKTIEVDDALERMAMKGLE